MWYFAVVLLYVVTLSLIVGLLNCLFRSYYECLIERSINNNMHDLRFFYFVGTFAKRKNEILKCAQQVIVRWKQYISGYRLNETLSSGRRRSSRG